MKLKFRIKKIKENYRLTNQGFVATGVLYSLVGILAIILFMTISNLATTRKIATAEDTKSKIATYQVIYNSNTGNGTMENSIFQSGKTHALKANAFAKVGYRFIGWGLTSTSTSNLYPDESLVNNQGSIDTNVKYLPVFTRRSINLYASWEAKTYTVSFNGNGGSVSTSSKDVTYGQTYGTLPSASRSNYTFLGWFTAASGGSQVTASTEVTITANQTLYAHWKSNSYPASVGTETYGADTYYETDPNHCMCSHGIQGLGHCQWHIQQGESVSSVEIEKYSCPRGGSLSGSTCTRTYYYCPNGGSLSGTTCVF